MRKVDVDKARLAEYDRLNNSGQILTPDGLRVICAGCDWDPEKIGRHMLEVLGRMQQGRSLEHMTVRATADRIF